MSEKAKLPYEGYFLYRVFDKKQERYLAVLFSTSHRTTIAYAKYVLEVHLGRKLNHNCEAHHKDENFANDSIDNLEELERGEHVKRHAKGQTMVSGVCLYCESPFVRPKRNAREMKYCTREHYNLAQKGKIPAGFFKKGTREKAPITHGTNTGYSNRGCRCEPCTEAHRQHCKEYRKRRAARACGEDL